MTPALQIVKAVFDVVVEHPEDEWTGVLREQCGDDDRLRHEVARRLDWHRQATAFLDTPVFQAPASASQDGDEHTWSPLPRGTRLGAYDVEDEIGRGGMGLVYRARRSDGLYERQVAIKIVDRADVLGSELAERLQQEARLLAAFEHPHIARLLDAGVTPRGDTYLVMEYVDGVPITRYCASRMLSARQRLTLFCQVCEAVSAAHRSPIVHRDLKPNNILVTADGVVKLLDFGVSASMTSTGPARASASRWLTPTYASPEQRAGAPPTTASDLYSLGLVLREVLLAAPAAPLTGELQSVLARATADEPRHRYGSVDQLREELQRLAHGFPAIAHPGGARYRFGKLLRRHPLRFAIGAAIVLVIGSAIGAMLWQGRIAAERGRENRRLLYATQMRLAQLAWDDASPGRALELLEAQRPPDGEADLRGFEWRVLWGLVHPPGFVYRHGDAVHDVAFSPDGSRIAAAGYDGRVRVWRHGEDAPDAVLDAHTGPARAVAFSPDGGMLASGGSDRVVILWDAATRQPRLRLPHDGPVRVLAFMDDGRLLVTGDTDGRLIVWRTADGARVHDFARMPSEIRSLSIADARAPASPAHAETRTRIPARIAIGTEDGDVIIFDVDPATWAWAEARPRQLATTRTLTGAVQFSPGGNWLASASSDGDVSIWDTRSGRSLRKWVIAGAGVIYAIAFDPGGAQLVVAHRGGGSVWRTSDWTMTRTLSGHDGLVLSTRFSSDGRRLLTGGADGLVREWEMEAAARPQLLADVDDEEHWALAYAPDGRRLAVGSDTGALQVCDAHSGALVASMPRDEAPGDGGRIRALAYAPDGALLAVGVVDGRLRLWSPAEQRDVRVVREHTAQIRGIAFSPDGTRAATASEDRTVVVWDARTWQPVRRLAHADRVRAVAFTPDGRTLVSAGDWRTAILWDLASGRQVAALAGHGNAINAIALSRDGRHVFTGSGDNTARAWDLRERRLLRTFKGHADRIWSLSLSADESRLATASSDRSIKLWNVETGDELVSLSGAAHARRAVVFSPDGLRLAASSTGQVMIWDGGR